MSAMSIPSSSSLPIWYGDYCDLPLYFVLVRRYSPEPPPPVQQLPIQPQRSASSTPLSRRSSIVSGMSASAHNIFRKKKSTTQHTPSLAFSSKDNNTNSSTSNIASRTSSPVHDAYAQEVSLYIYQLILSLPNTFRDRFVAPFPKSVDEYTDALIRMLPKEWPEMAISGALKRMTTLQYTEFASFRHFLWEFRRLKLVAQSTDRKAFLIFLAIIPTDLRVAISRSGINQYSQLACIEEYDKLDTKLMALDPRCRKHLRLDMHKDRLLFSLHLPSTLFNRILKTKHKLIDSLAMSWFQLSTTNAISFAGQSSSPNHRQMPKNLIYNANSASQSTFLNTSAPSYSYENSSTKTLPFYDFHVPTFQPTGNNIFSTSSANQPYQSQLLPKNVLGASSHEVVISDNLVYFNQRLHLSQSLMTSVVKHWYNCFTASFQKADAKIFNSLTENNFSFKPAFDFSQTLYSKPDFNPLSNNSSAESFHNQMRKDEFDSLFANTNFINSKLSSSSSNSNSNGTAYYKPWQIVKVSYVSGNDLLEFATLSKKPHYQKDRKLSSDRSNRRARQGSGSNTTNARQSHGFNPDVCRVDSKASNSSTTSSNDPSSLFSSSDSVLESDSSYSTNATSTTNSTANSQTETGTEKTQAQTNPNADAFQDCRKDFIILTCCETLEVYLAPVDPTDPPLAIVQTVLIPFAHQYGYPLAVLTDRSAPNKFFTSNLFQSFWKAHGTSTFHQSTISSAATSMSAIHIEFVKTYLACFARELQNGLHGQNDDDNLLPNATKKGLDNQHGLDCTSGPDSGYSRTASLAGCTKRLMAALNDFIAFYDTNGGNALEGSLYGGPSSATASRASSIHRQRSLPSLRKQRSSVSSSSQKHSPVHPSQDKEQVYAAADLSTAPNSGYSNIYPSSNKVGGMNSMSQPCLVRRRKSITKTHNTNASFTAYDDDETFPEFVGGNRNSMRYSSHMNPEDFGKREFNAAGEGRVDSSGIEAPYFVTDGYRDTIFYRTLTIAIKKFTDITEMHSNRCVRIIESPVEPDLNKGQSSWATVIPWKFRKQEWNEVKRSHTPSMSSLRPPPAFKPAVTTSPKRLSSNLSKYCDYYESLGQQNQNHVYNLQMPSRSFLHQKNSSCESIESTGLSSKGYGSSPTTGPLPLSDKTDDTPTELRDHVIIKDTLTAVLSIFGYCEYLGIPCFLVQTDSRYVPGVAWVTGFQFTACSHKMRSAIRASYKSNSQDIPSTVRYLVSSCLPRTSHSKRTKTRSTTKHKSAQTHNAFLKQQIQNDLNSSYTNQGLYNCYDQSCSSHDLHRTIPRANRQSHDYNYSTAYNSRYDQLWNETQLPAFTT